MFPAVTAILLLQLPLSVGTTADADCLFRRGSSVRTEGDVVIGAFLTLFTFFYLTSIVELEPSKDFYHPQFMSSNYQHVLALVFAVEEINRDPQLLPNITLGYEFHNVLHTHWRALESSLLLLTGQDEIPNYTCRREIMSVAVLTGASWEAAAQFGPVLELYRLPQLVFGSFNPRLSDKGRFPSLYQLAPKDTALALGMVSLMLHFGWTWVGLVIAEGQKGLQFLSDMRGEMERNGVCVAFVKTIPSVSASFVAATHDFLTRETPPVNVVAIYYDTDSQNGVNYHVGQQLVTWRVWVTNSQWHADIAGRNLILDSFHGTLIFSNHHEEISGFQKFIDTVNPSRYPEDNFLALYWFKSFGCSLSDSDCALKDCALNASLTWLPVNRFDPAMSDGSYNIYNAVYAVAHALQEMLCQQVQMQPGGKADMAVPSPWQLHPFLKNIQLQSPAGDQVNLDDARKLQAEYDIVNIWNLPEGLRLRVKTPRSVCSESCGPGFRKTLREGKAACCFDCAPCPENEITNDTDTEQCVRCPDHQYANTQHSCCLEKSVTFLAYEDPLGKALAATALSLTVLTAGVLGLFVKHRDTPIVKANNRGLSYTLLVSLAFCFLSSLLFIGHPNTATCVLRQTTFGAVFTVAVSTVLAKTVTVVLAFKVTTPGRRVRQLLVSGAPNSIIPICSLIQLTLCGIWMGTSPPFIDTDAHSEHGHIIILCNKGSLTAFYCVLGYLGSLALGSFTVAFLARNLPDTFNEAKYLTFSMLVFCSVWVTFLPVYHSTQGKAMVAMEVFSILASSAGLLGCIFAPKCYVILFRAQKNSLHRLKNKMHSRRVEMPPVVIVFFVLQPLFSDSNSDNEDCFLTRGTSVRQEGDVLYPGLPVGFDERKVQTLRLTAADTSCCLVPVRPMFNNYQNVLALIFAIKEINENPHLLPNLTLGYEFHNTLHSSWRTLESSLILLTGQYEMPNYTCRRGSASVVAMTGASWETAAQVGTLLELYRSPQISFGSYNPRLSDKGRFPSLYQMAPKDTALALGMVSLMLHFGWTWVGLVIAEGQKGLQFLSDMRGEMDRNGVCVAFVQMISSFYSMSYVLTTHDFLSRETSPVNVVAIYDDTDSRKDVNYHMGQQLVTWRVWVTNSQWHADMAGRNFILDSFHGTLMFSHHHKKISGFQNFLQTVNPSRYPEDNLLALYWFKSFGCSISDSDCALKDCALNASLTWLPVNRFDPAMSDGSYNIYNAVYAVAHALQEMLRQQVQTQPGGDWDAMVFSAWQMHPFLKKVQFYNPAGDQMSLDDTRKLEAEYDIVNFWNFPEGLRLRVMTPRSVCSESCGPGFRKTLREGRVPCCFDCTPCPENEITSDADMEQCVRCPDHTYSNTQRSRCLHKSVTFLAYEDPLGKALTAAALSLTVLTAGVLGLFVKHRDTPIVKANNRGLSYTLLVSLAFCFLCSLLFIGRPNTATCVLRQTTFGVVFTMAVSTVLAKTVTVVLAFKVTAPGRKARRLLVSGAPNSIIPICSLIQLTLCGIWMGTSPPFIDTDAHSEHGHVIIVCNKGSLTAFYCVLGYLGSLALGSFTVAFLARNLPDTFNEAKFLTFSMLVFCSVWVTFLPVYHSTRGKAMVAMEVFSILASGAGLLGCIFAPKCYIILLRPERNSLHSFRDKTHRGRTHLS
ncbi:uncharacterized protein ACOB6Z_012587 [Ctenodactylus gundi]